jgi:sn-glycerol 3-phosphate transport system ATP-binding protein
VEQDAAPAELYASPATRFAASFIGTPPMNLLPTEPTHAGLVVAGSSGPVLRANADRKLLAGIRPENLHLSAHGLAVTVTGAEYLGADTILECAAGQTRLLARAPGRVEASEGSTVHLAFDPAALHFFDAETGRRFPCPS